MRKAQVTYFIITGLILLMIIVASQQWASTEPQVPLESASLQADVQSCLSQALTNTLVDIGMQGGYLDPPDPMETYFGKSSVYRRESEIQIPTQETVKASIEESLRQEAALCGSRVGAQQASKVTVTITQDHVIATVQIPIITQAGAQQRLLSDFVVEVPSRIPLYLETAHLILESKDQGIPVSTIMDLSQQYDVTIDVYYQQESPIYVIQDNLFHFGTDSRDSVLWLFADVKEEKHIDWYAEVEP